VSLIRELKQRRTRIKLRVRNKLAGNKDLPRVSVNRSLKNISGQVIDDNLGTTLASCSSIELDKLKGDKSEIAKAVGIELAKRSLSKGISSIRFDRGRFLYHGRVKAFADGLREGGLKF
jgi:large subunit ribosomal protein L18